MAKNEINREANYVLEKNEKNEGGGDLKVWK